MELLQANIPHNSRYESIKPLLRQFNAVLAGGAARQLYLNDGSFGSTDVDLYFFNNKDKYNIKRCLLKAGKEKRASEYAKTFMYKDLLLQIVDDRPNSIENLFSTYDFYCCMFAIVNNKIVYPKEAFEDVLSKTLRDNNYSKYYIKDYRILKYVLKKGYEPGTPHLKTRFDILMKDFLSCEREINIDDWLEGRATPNYHEGIFGGMYLGGGRIFPDPQHQWNHGALFDNALNLRAAANAMMNNHLLVQAAAAENQLMHIEERIINNNNDINLGLGDLLPEGEQQN